LNNWISSISNENKIVISSRVRLARNIKDKKFPHKLNIEEGKELVKNIENTFFDVGNFHKDFKIIYLWENELITNEIFLEKQLISDELLCNMDKSAFIVNKDETISLMLNEEDHLRIQCISSGLNLKENYDLVSKLDDMLEKKIDYAFHEQFGYLTACPTNSGTGLRAAVMLHLPMLSMQNEMEKIFNTVSQVGMTISGVYGESSRVEGNLYQISNQVTLGLEENEILNNLIVVVKQIINQEKLCRDRIMKKYEFQIKDKIFRSLGILKSAYLLQLEEALKLLSSVRLGVEMGIIKDVNLITLNELLIDISKDSIQSIYKNISSKQEIALKRAEIVKNKL
jgi:protein arginine kinase